MKKNKKSAALAFSLSLSFLLCSANVSAASYTVIPKDSLYKIGVLFQLPVSTIKADNNLTTDMIYPGQVLTVQAFVHTVKSGDTLYLISKNYNITLTALRSANHKWDDAIYPGQTLVIPGVKPSDSVPKPTAVIPYTNAEADLLARLITAEATNEPYDAMVGVGAVVVNRVLAPEWPATINDVINHVTGGYYQFTPVINGYINNPASPEAVKAAWAALYGSDPSNKAIFYYDNTSTNQWIRAKTVTAQIGSMIYAK